MTIREAIHKLIMFRRILERGVFPVGYIFDAEPFDLAISALEKQEKKPARAKFNKRYNKFVYFCPVCGEVTGGYDFCSECGQAIDYDNSEPYTEEES